MEYKLHDPVQGIIIWSIIGIKLRQLAYSASDPMLDDPMLDTQGISCMKITDQAFFGIVHFRPTTHDPDICKYIEVFRESKRVAVY